jgi:L-amino acid N-acyltransferase YncA
MTVDEVLVDLRERFADWAVHREELLRVGPYEELVRRLDDLPDDRRADFVASDDFERLADELAPPTPGTPSFDEGVWTGYLTTNAVQWDGTDESWEAFAEWFAYHADERGVGEPATALMARLAHESDRIGVLAGYGVVITPPEQTDEYDENVWHDYLATNAVRWDGTEESWAQFVEWFDYHADDRGVSAPATALTAHLADMVASDRVETLARYGVVIGAEGAATEDAATEDAATEDAAAEDDQFDIDSVVDEVLADNPEFAEIPARRREELVAEVLAELGAE